MAVAGKRIGHVLRARLFTPAAVAEACGIAVLLVAAEPLASIGAFYVDWGIHLWNIAYFRQYFLLHLQFPLLLDTSQWVANPLPLFYGYVFYPLFALLSLPFPVQGTMRVAALFALVLPYVTWRAATRDKFGSAVGIAIALIATTSVYQLTNLYNRSALTEFFAFQALLAGWPLLVLAAHGGYTRRKLLLGFSALALFAFSFGSHPITALLGGLVSVVILPAAVILRDRGYLIDARRKVVWVGICAFLLLLVLSGWLAALGHGQRDLLISQMKPTMLTYFSFDLPIYRVLPYPEEPRILRWKIPGISTPFLSAPVNLAAVVVMVALCLGHRARGGLGRNLGSFCAYWIVGWLYLYLASLNAYDVIVLPFLFSIQFSYRLVNAINLWALVAMLLLLQVTPRRGEANDQRAVPSPFLAGFCLCLALVGVVGKVHQAHLEYSSAGVQPNPVAGLIADRDSIVKHPQSYGMFDYTQPLLFGNPSAGYNVHPISLTVGSSMEADPYLLALSGCNPLCLVTTNILPSQYMRVVVDGNTLTPRQNDRIVIANRFVGLLLGNGDHTIQVSRRVPGHIVMWRTLGLSTFFALCGGVVAAWVWIAVAGIARSRRRLVFTR